ncbi:MAG: hypothetical protein AB1896_15525 [Thermodesulfobacteriota bacterium]
MNAAQTSKVKEIRRDEPRCCPEECLWYEPVRENGSCLNRQSFVCQLHRREVFRVPEEHGPRR